ncbi:MAG: RNA degradosome polyphosphate kinase, partial [Gammaproteobacteria bacterium]|nr:RNA degradosome polyphosphate kinase [Gammaproteobacteria bacterium]
MANVIQNKNTPSNTVSISSANANAASKAAGTTSVVAQAADIDLDDKALYLNRELTWLAFNGRVLSMAADSKTPLLERVKYLAITGNNLDEFQMKRIGGLKQQLAAGVRDKTIDGLTPAEQIAVCQVKVRELHNEQNRILRELMVLLSAQNIKLVNYDSLNAEEKGSQRKNFIENIFPLLTPLAMDPGHPFPFISNLALNLLVSLRHKG